MKNWMDYMKIQELKRNHLNKSQASRKLGLDYKTVCKYWDMPAEVYAKVSEGSKTRKKKPDEHKEFVVECLRKYPDMTASQLYDWIKERTGNKKLPFQKRGFQNYVNSIRKEYNVPKPESGRDYEAVEDPPMGKQAQVDMGEISLETPSGRHKKSYGFGMVMSNSRQKYIEWQLHPWTTADFIAAHIRAFQFYGGRPEEIVYDQDKVLAVSENSGDIILTEGFQNYVNATGFRVVLCHGADPESKGRIENVIKYAKHGFAEHRILGDIDDFNKDCLAWLERTGNAEEHGTTKKIPAEVFAVEKEHLIPVSEYGQNKPSDRNISYQVRKDNVVLYKGNRYRVPVGTYKPGKQVRVYMVVENEEVSIVDTDTGVEYARHRLSTGKGELIGEKTRNNRDKTKSILELEELVENQFGGGIEIHDYLTRIHLDKPRYYRDQLGVIRNLFNEWDADLIQKGLAYCIEKELYSAAELSSSVAYMASIQLEKKPDVQKGSGLPPKYRGNNPPIRSLSDYSVAMGRE